MATITVQAESTPTIWRWPGTIAYLRIFANSAFQSAAGAFIGQGNPAQVNSFYLQIACTVVDNVLTIPSFTIQSTTDSPTNPAATYTARLYSQSGAFVGNYLASFPLSDQLPTPTWTQIILYKNQRPSRPILQGVWDTGQVQDMINIALAELRYASDSQIGNVFLDVDPVDPLIPIAVGANSTALGNLHGTLTANRTPRAVDSTHLEDGLPEDDGTSFNVQTLGQVGLGDLDPDTSGGQGSFISVNDSITEEGGRANLYAAGSDQAEYAGFSADCSNGAGEVNVQSTGITNLYGINQITTLGDGKDEQNGTHYRVNDPTGMAIQTVLAQVPNDLSLVPNDLCFYLAGGHLMARIQLSDGAMATWDGGAYTPDGPSASPSASTSASPSVSSSPSSSPSPSASVSASPSVSVSASASASVSASVSASLSSSVSASPSAS